MKPTSVKKIFALAVSIFAFAAFFIWGVMHLQSSSQTVHTSDKVQIVASTNVWGDIAAQVGGDRVEVTSVLNDPGADPHLFESDAKTASLVGSAQLVIINGLGYDEFMDKLLDVAPDSNRTVINVSEVLGAGKNANPHLWYDLPRIHEIAVAIQNQLISIDPGGADGYRHNTQALVSNLTILNDQITPRSGGVAYTERVAGYLLNDLGLSDKTPKGFSESVENGTEPTPQQVQEFEDVLKSGQVKVLLYNNQAVNDVTMQIQKAAKKSGVAVVGVSETIPKGKNFQTWQANQLHDILRAL